MTSGILIVDKPVGLTSNQVVSIAKKNLKIKKIGHSGTLDPFASGLMILLVGRATKFQSYLMNADKTYEVGFIFGEETDTLDSTGKVVKKTDHFPTAVEIKKTIQNNFLGLVEQTPPIYSAIHINGKRAYKLAREGKNISMPKRKINIHAFEIKEYFPPKLLCEIKCSKGTYIRSIGRDLALALDSFGHAFYLRRKESGCFHLRQSILPKDIDLKHIKSVTETVKNISNEMNQVVIDKKSLELLKQGDYQHLIKQLEKKLNALYIDEECVAVIDYIEGKFKMIYH